MKYEEQSLSNQITTSIVMRNHYQKRIQTLQAEMDFLKCLIDLSNHGGKELFWDTIFQIMVNNKQGDMEFCQRHYSNYLKEVM